MKVKIYQIPASGIPSFDGFINVAEDLKSYINSSQFYDVFFGNPCETDINTVKGSELIKKIKEFRRLKEIVIFNKNS